MRRSARFRVAMAAVLVMPVMLIMSMAAVVMARVRGCAVGAALGFKSFLNRVHDQVHGAQQVGQYMVWLDLQVVRLELNRHMAVAQVVGGACQVKGRAVCGAGADAQHWLRRRQHADHGAVLDHQHVATAQQGAARQKNTQVPAQRVGGVETAFLAHIPVELDGGGAFDQHGS